MVNGQWRFRIAVSSIVNALTRGCKNGQVYWLAIPGALVLCGHGVVSNAQPPKSRHTRSTVEVKLRRSDRRARSLSTVQVGERMPSRKNPVPANVHKERALAVSTASLVMGLLLSAPSV